MHQSKNSLTFFTSPLLTLKVLMSEILPFSLLNISISYSKKIIVKSNKLDLAFHYVKLKEKCLVTKTCVSKNYPEQLHLCFLNHQSSTDLL